LCVVCCVLCVVCCVLCLVKHPPEGTGSGTGCDAIRMTLVFTNIVLE